MLVEESHIPAVLEYPIEKIPKESDQADMEAVLQNRHIQLFGSRILWRDTALLEMSCEQALRYVETILSLDKTLESSPKNSVLRSAAAVNNVHLLRCQRKVLDP